jgi:hypothetical protein
MSSTSSSDRCFSVVVLGPVWLVMEAVVRGQVFVLSLLDDFAAVDGQHPVGPTHGAQAMRGNRGCATQQEPIEERVCHGLGGYRAPTWPVQNHRFRIAEHHPGDRQPLPLAA